MLTRLFSLTQCSWANKSERIFDRRSVWDLLSVLKLICESSLIHINQNTLYFLFLNSRSSRKVILVSSSFMIQKNVWLLIKNSSLIFQVVKSHDSLTYLTSTLKHTMTTIWRLCKTKLQLLSNSQYSLRSWNNDFHHHNLSSK